MEGPSQFLWNTWNCIDFCNLMIFVVMIFFRLYCIALTSMLMFDPDPYEFSDFVEVSWAIYQVQNWTAVNLVLSWFKLFKYLRLSPRLNQLTATIQTASTDLAG